MFDSMITRAFLLTIAMVLSMAAQAQEIARLYAERAPAGSAYVRVVNPGGPAVAIEFSGKRGMLDTRHPPATDYRIVNASRPMVLEVNGRALPPIAVQAGTFNTIAVIDGAALPLLDAIDNRDDLKAELRFYNFARGCQASLALRSGGAVFANVDYPAGVKRNIKPVKAELVATCAGGGTSSPVALPTLKSGDHASLFLSGPADRPRLQVQADATEIYTAAR